MRSTLTAKFFVVIAASTIAAMTIAACVPVALPPQSPLATRQLQPESNELSESEVVDAARVDLATQLGVLVHEVEVVEVRAVTWADGSIGCPQLGTPYTQATVDGWLILLQANGERYSYHGSTMQAPFLCGEGAGVLRDDVLREDEFVPPPGSEID